MNIHLDHVIAQIVESFLERGNRKECMLFHVNASASYYFPNEYVEKKIIELEQTNNSYSINYDDISAIEVFKMLSFIIYRPANYTKVIYNISDKPMFFDHRIYTFHHSSYHDSCWRTDGVSHPITSLRRLLTKLISEEYTKRINEDFSSDISFYTQLEKIEKCDCVWVDDCHNLNSGLHSYTYNVHKDFNNNNNQLVMELEKNDE